MGVACFAAACLAGLSLLDPRVLTVTIMLTGALLLGAAVIALVDRWRKRQANVLVVASDQLAHYRALYERGELSKDEFDRIKEQINKPLKGPPKTVAPKPGRNPEGAKPVDVEKVAPPALPAESPTTTDQPTPDAGPTPPESSP